jgi:hypothetical protein
MMKKLSILLAAVAVLAFTVPAFANAETGLTEEANTLVPAGTKIEATNVGNIVWTSSKLGNITCKSVTLTGVLTTNTLSTVLMSPTTDGIEHNFAKECSVPSGADVEALSVVVNEVHTTGEIVSGSKKKGKITATVVFKIMHSTTCTLTASSGEWTYIAGSDVLKVFEAPLTVTGGAACGTTAKWDGEFTVRTDVSPFAGVTIM